MPENNELLKSHLSKKKKMHWQAVNGAVIFPHFRSDHGQDVQFWAGPGQDPVSCLA